MAGTLTWLIAASSLALNVYFMVATTFHSCQVTPCSPCTTLEMPCHLETPTSQVAQSWSPDTDKGFQPSEGVGSSEATEKVDGEIGWNFALESKRSQTDNTVYDPNAEAKEKLAQLALPRYARSPVPKGLGWKVRVGKDRWITMDDVAFAYDVWFEENQIFQYASWMGVFIQQDPMDAFAIQDMLWRVKPDLIIEVGTNTGGGAIFYATIMKGYNPHGKIVTLDVKEVSNWNKRNNHRCPGCILATDHAWWGDGMIHFVKGRVTEADTRKKVEEFTKTAKIILVIEDASHRYPDTLQNLEAIHSWVTPGSYLLVQDTKMDRFVGKLGKRYGNLKFGPMRSVDEFLAKHGSSFVIDRRFEYFLYSQHHRGWLRKK